MNHGAYQHFLRVFNDYCETSWQRMLEGQGRRAIVLNGSLPGTALPTFSYFVPWCSLHPVLVIVKEWDSIFWSQLELNEPPEKKEERKKKKEGRKAGRKEGKEKMLERRREWQYQSPDGQCDWWLRWVSRGLHLASAQLSINRPISVLAANTHYFLLSS